MKNPNGPCFVSFTAKGYLVNQMLEEGWELETALVHADRLFSADGTEPGAILGHTELQHVKAYIAACDQPPASTNDDDYIPRVEETACGSLEVHA